MAITKRKLTKWRKEALNLSIIDLPGQQAFNRYKEQCKHVLQMTQELLDLHLLKEKD